MLKILNYIASALGIVVIAAGGIGYVNNIDAKATTASALNSGRIDSVQGEITDLKSSISQVANAASAAQADSAATRKFTEFIVARLGGDTKQILKNATSSDN